MPLYLPPVSQLRKIIIKGVSILECVPAAILTSDNIDLKQGELH